jgi:2,3-bisphosphoglycerate-independent phosphoglycerate mutase
LEKIKENTFKFILVNFANPDMVAHSGKVQPTIEAVEEVDRNLGKIVDLALANYGAVIITADHGNAEEVINLKSGEADTKHSQALVPFIIVSSNKSLSVSSEQGILADVAPTVLKLLQIAKPNIMTGKSLI